MKKIMKYSVPDTVKFVEKMTKKSQKTFSIWLSVLLTVVLIISLTACGESQTNSGGTGSSTKSDTDSEGQYDEYNSADAENIETDDEETASVSSLYGDENIESAGNDSEEEPEKEISSDMTVAETVTIYLTAQIEYTDSEGNTYVVDEINYDENGCPVTETVYNKKNGELAGSYNFSCDAEGNIVKQLSYDSNGELTSVIVMTYDSEGNVLTQDYSFEENGRIYTNYVYTYDYRGNLLTEACYVNGKEAYMIEYIFDKYNNLTSEVKYDDGVISEASYYEYTYDENGNILEDTKYNIDNELTRSGTYTYDSDGNMLTMYYSSYGNTSLYREYTYDENGILLVIDEYKIGREVYGNYEWQDHYVYTYDENSNQLTESYYNQEDVCIYCYNYIYVTMTVPVQ